MSAHTPGPWFLIPGDWLCPRIGAPGFKRAVADAIQRDPHPVDGEGIDSATAEANARLIAAAPELLEALIQASRVMEIFAQISPDDVPLAGSIRQMMRAAIARATGEEVV